MVGALVMYTQIGIFDRNYKTGGARGLSRPGWLKERVASTKSKLTKRALPYGGRGLRSLPDEITAPDGSHVYSGKKTIVGNDEPSAKIF